MDVEKLVLIGKMTYKTELLDVRRVQARKKEGRCQDLDLKMESRKKRVQARKKYSCARILTRKEEFQIKISTVRKRNGWYQSFYIKPGYWPYVFVSVYFL